MGSPRDFTPGDGHGYIEGVPYAEVLAMWDPESIDSPERYFPYSRGLGAGQGLIPAPQREREKRRRPNPSRRVSPARIPDPHLTPAQHDPEGD